MNRPFSESCEQNREPILAVLRRFLEGRRSLLEIGSGTGQHAVYFAPEFPHLTWQTSDRTQNHPGILAWLDEYPADNLRLPLALDVAGDPWPEPVYDTVFSANTAHIMHPPQVQAMFEGVGRLLPTGGLFLLYGPFNIGGCYTAPSNERFDRFLREQDPGMGVRDLGWLEQLGGQVDLHLGEMLDMPADNKTLVWVKH